jgi:hypothetical protein
MHNGDKPPHVVVVVVVVMVYACSVVVVMVHACSVFLLPFTLMNYYWTEWLIDDTGSLTTLPLELFVSFGC